MADGLDWRAIGIAIAVGLGGSLLLGTLFQALPYDGVSIPLGLYLGLSYGSALLVDLATGATAGAIARRRGLAHALVAVLVCSVVSPLLGLAMTLVRNRPLPDIGLLDYLGAIAGSTVAGIVIACVAGAVAARMAARRVAVS